MGGGLMGREVAMRLIFLQTDLGARRPFNIHAGISTNASIGAGLSHWNTEPPALSIAASQSLRGLRRVFTFTPAAS